MTNSMPQGRSADAHFSITKLLVGDLEKAAAFYASVCGLVEPQRLDATLPIRSGRCPSIAWASPSSRTSRDL